MSLTIKAGAEGSFTPVPPGIHLARCYKVISLGTQKYEYKGEIKHQPKVMVQFEVHGEDDQGKPLVTSKGEPMSISKNYTASLNESATLRTDLKTWRGRDFTSEELRGFTLKNILDKWAMITVIKSLGRDGKEYTNINSILPVSAKIKQAGLPNGFNKVESFDVSEPDMEVFEKLSENVKNKIKNSPEWQAREQPEEVGADAAMNKINKLDDDIPF